MSCGVTRGGMFGGASGRAPCAPVGSRLHLQALIKPRRRRNPLKNIDFTRKVVTGACIDLARKVRLQLANHSDVDYEVMKKIELTALRGESKTAPGELFITALAEHIMKLLGQENEVKGNGSQVSRAVKDHLRV